MRNKIFLGGGGTAEQSKEFDRRFLHEINSSFHKASCLYIPNALTASRHESAFDWFTSNYSDFFETVIPSGDLGKFKTDDIYYDVIYIGGGNTGRLLDEIYETEFDLYLKRHLDKGGLLYGGSAGAIILGRTILTATPREYSATNNYGLDLLGGRSVAAHYSNETAKEYALQMSKSLDTEILAIPEDSGVILDSLGNLYSAGNSDVFVISPDGLIKILQK